MKRSIVKEVIKIENLNSKNEIRISSKNNEIDFSEKSTHVSLILNNSTKPVNFFAELYIHENKQPQTKIFDIPVPKNSESATIEFSTDIVNYDLNKITAIAV